MARAASSQELAPLAEVNVNHPGQGRRQEGRVRRSARRLLSRLRQEGHGAHPALRAAIKDAGEGQGQLLLAVAVVLLAAGTFDVIWAQGSPLGVPRPQSAPP